MGAIGFDKEKDVWQVSQSRSLKNSRSRADPRIVPIQSAKAAKSYARCRTPFGFANQYPENEITLYGVSRCDALAMVSA